MSDDNSNVEIDVNTDDLDDFTLLFNGKAKPATEAEEVEEEALDAEEPAEAEEQTEGDEPDDVEDEEEAEEPKPKSRKTAKDRISELTANRREAEKRAVEAETRLAQLEARLARIETPNPQENVVVDKGPTVPTPDDVDDKGELLYALGEFDPKYITALTKFTFQQEVARQAEENAKAAAANAEQARRDELADQWKTRLDEKVAEIPDYKETVATLDDEFRHVDPAYGAYLVDAIMQMEAGPEVLYYLAKNKAEAQKIVASGPLAATLALGRLESILTPKTEAKPEKRDIKVSAAPTPPVTTRGTGGSVGVPADTDDLDAFERQFYRKKR